LAGARDSRATTLHAACRRLRLCHHHVGGADAADALRQLSVHDQVGSGRGECASLRSRALSRFPWPMARVSGVRRTGHEAGHSADMPSLLSQPARRCLAARTVGSAVLCRDSAPADRAAPAAALADWFRHGDDDCSRCCCWWRRQWRCFLDCWVFLCIVLYRLLTPDFAVILFAFAHPVAYLLFENMNSLNCTHLRACGCVALAYRRWSGLLAWLGHSCLEAVQSGVSAVRLCFCQNSNSASAVVATGSSSLRARTRDDLCVSRASAPSRRSNAPESGRRTSCAREYDGKYFFFVVSLWSVRVGAWCGGRALKWCGV
jgi:hypothetical protein